MEVILQFHGLVPMYCSFANKITENVIEQKNY